MNNTKHDIEQTLRAQILEDHVQEVLPDAVKQVRGVQEEVINKGRDVVRRAVVLSALQAVVLAEGITLLETIAAMMQRPASGLEAPPNVDPQQAALELVMRIAGMTQERTELKQKPTEEKT